MCPGLQHPLWKPLQWPCLGLTPPPARDPCPEVARRLGKREHFCPWSHRSDGWTWGLLEPRAAPLCVQRKMQKLTHSPLLQLGKLRPRICESVEGKRKKSSFVLKDSYITLIISLNSSVFILWIPQRTLNMVIPVAIWQIRKKTKTPKVNAFFKSTHKLSPRLSDSKAFVHVQKEEAGRRGRGLILCQALCQVTSSSGSPLLLPSLLWARHNYTHFRGKKIEFLGMRVLAKATQAVSSQARPQSRLNFHPLTLLNDNEPQSLGLFPALPLASVWFGENCLLLSTSVSSSELWKDRQCLSGL